MVNGRTIMAHLTDECWLRAPGSAVARAIRAASGVTRSHCRRGVSESKCHSRVVGQLQHPTKYGCMDPRRFRLSTRRLRGSGLHSLRPTTLITWPVRDPIHGRVQSRAKDDE